MKICSYLTKAARYARDLAAVFPKRQFKVALHPCDFRWTVGLYEDGRFIAYVTRRKGKIGGKLATDDHSGEA